MGPAASQVHAQIERAKTRFNVVYQEALVLLAEDMQKPISEGGNMPVDTGFLRSSLKASLGDQVPAMQRHPGGSMYGYDASEVNSVLRTATIRANRATLAYSAEYATFLEYRHKFKALAVQKWPVFVAKAAAMAKVV